MRAAESWARSQGSTELASDTETDNVVSGKAHAVLGFAETALIRCFRKSLQGESVPLADGHGRWIGHHVARKWLS
jgi:hypothetical protein